MVDNAPISEGERLPLNIQSATYATDTARPAASTRGFGADGFLPVTTRMIPPTIMRNGKETTSAISCETGPKSE